MAVSQVCFVHVLTQTSSLIRAPTIAGSLVKIYKPGHKKVIRITCLQKHTMEKRGGGEKKSILRDEERKKSAATTVEEKAADENHGNWDYLQWLL